MIKLTVQTSPSRDHIGEYTFHKNLIYVGSNPDSDLFLEDSAVDSNHLFIEIVDGQLLAHLGKSAELFWVDGKRTTKFKFLAPGSQIKVGSTTFKILLFSPSSKASKREVLNKNTDELLASKSPLLDCIKELRKEL